MGAFAFVSLYARSYNQVINAYLETSLGADLLTFYGILFGALMVVIALITPKGDSFKKRDERERDDVDLDNLYYVEGFTLALIFVNVGTHFPMTYFGLVFLVGAQIVSFPWLFFAVSGVLLRLRLIFLT